MKEYLISSTLISLILFLNSHGYCQYQTEGLIMHYAKMQSPEKKGNDLYNWEERNPTWFKDSCVIFELRTNIETSEQTPLGTIVKRSHPVWKYIYLNMRTMICQDYLTFTDTAKPFCNYYLTPKDTLTDFWRFYHSKEIWDTTPGMSVMKDTAINNISYKRIKVLYKYYSYEPSYIIYYLNCNTSQNMFHLNKTLDEMYPGCKSTSVEQFDSAGNLTARSGYEVIRDTLTETEEKVFKQWHENSKATTLSLFSYKEARKNCQVYPVHENPTITIRPTARLQQVQSNVKPDEIKIWLLKDTSPLTPHKNEIIKRLLENALFDKMYVESYHDKENLIIVPLKKVYFSQHAKIKNVAPLQYLLLVENSKGEIRRSDLVLFYPTDSNLTALPQNSFYYFFKGGSLSVDGTLTLITLGDVKQYEMDFKNWQKKEFRMWQGRKQNQKNSSACSDWYLITTVYHEDGNISQQEIFLGATCTGCEPNEVCDTIDSVEDDGSKSIKK